MRNKLEEIKKRCEKHDWDYEPVKENPSQTIILVDRKCKRCNIREYAVFEDNEFMEILV